MSTRFTRDGLVHEHSDSCSHWANDPFSSNVLITEEDLQWALEETNKRYPHVGLMDDLDSRWVAYTLMARLKERINQGLTGKLVGE